MVQYIAPDIYHQWWADTNACGGWTDDEAEYVSGGYWVMFKNSIHTDRGLAAGMLAGSRQIWFALPYIYDKGAVQHEQMHAHLVPRGIGDHPPRYFGDCGIPSSRNGVSFDAPLAGPSAAADGTSVRVQ